MKEGWQITKLVKKTKRQHRWNGIGWMNWTQLARQYLELWDTTKPILLECSPPEIQAPKKLVEAFPDHSVKFIMLVRGDCTTSRGLDDKTRSAGYANVLKKYPRDTFVVRYEDLCLRWKEVYKHLVSWEPLLEDVDIAKVPAVANKKDDKHHSVQSIQEYCHNAVKTWAKPKETSNIDTDVHPFAKFGYENTSYC
eukprot:CAMPEP_0194408160 /NCGR_PEP_ID=MMETSP0176-20130528/6110_1 /TAXON_ID=216777 /ORGANISM="Proboscia alata, Strain PI-D3" /LENGTH=194 /DNA_ID=CAMNT_0039208151 /DNA_START=463 /DNA_END=1047 /DNA_ORIENTATION=+